MKHYVLSVDAGPLAQTFLFLLAYSSLRCILKQSKEAGNKFCPLFSLVVDFNFVEW